MTIDDLALDDLDRTLCTKCDHFIEPNYSHQVEPTAGYAEFMHLDDSDIEYDHDAAPGEVHTLREWSRLRPDLFEMHADGHIGPNSPTHPRHA